MIGLLAAHRPECFEDLELLPGANLSAITNRLLDRPTNRKPLSGRIDQGCPRWWVRGTGKPWASASATTIPKLFRMGREHQTAPRRKRPDLFHFHVRRGPMKENHLPPKPSGGHCPFNLFLVASFIGALRSAKSNPSGRVRAQRPQLTSAGP